MKVVPEEELLTAMVLLHDAVTHRQTALPEDHATSTGPEELLRAASDTLSKLRRDMQQRQQKADASLDALRWELHNLRLFPLNGLLEPLRRMVRDLAQDSGKTAEFEYAGEMSASTRASSKPCRVR